MKRPLRKIDYVTKDYEGFRQMMIDLISIFTPEWTDTSQSDFGIVLIDLFSHGLDILSYYQDKAVNENLITTATLGSSVERLARFLGYIPYTQSPSKVNVTFKKYGDLLNKEIIVPKGTKVSTKDESVIFETEKELIIPEGNLESTVSSIQGETIEDELLGVSNGKANQTFTISLNEVLDDTVGIYIADTENSVEIWDKVDNFLNSQMMDNHFITERSGDFTFVLFGSGSSGRIPPINSKIYVTYRVGGGTQGNVGVNTVVELYDDFVEGIDEVYNTEVPYIEGRDSEDIERMRYLAPKNFSANDRAVTCSDFEANAESVIGVYKAKGEEFAGLNKDELYLYIVPTTFDIPTIKLKEKVLEAINNKRIVNTKVKIQDPNYIDFTLKLDLEVKDGYSIEYTTETLKSLVLETFNIDSMNFAEKIELMDILFLAKEIEGIKSLNISSDCVLPEVGKFEIIRLQDVTITIV